MARTIHLRVEGETERFLQEMNILRLSERDTFAKALGLLSMVHKTGRVALLRPNAGQSVHADELIEYVFTLQELEPADEQGVVVPVPGESALVQQSVIEITTAKTTEDSPNK